MARVRFGTFDFDPDTHELRREGAPVRLQAQPARVLSMLLAEPGGVVTRESLQRAVWGEETYVDFDRGLNFCIGQIRSALRDSAESPTFIRTIPKNGYQFIAPVTVAENSLPSPAEAVAPRQSSAKLWVLWGALVAVAIGTAIVLRWAHLWSSPPSIPNVAVTRFDNETGNAAFDRFADGIADSVVADLTGSAGGRYGVIGNAAILRLPRDQRDLIAIGSSLHAKYVILGQVRGIPSGVSVLAHLIRLPEQTHVKVARIDSKPGQALGAEFELARSIVASLAPEIATDSHGKAASQGVATY